MKAYLFLVIFVFSFTNLVVGQSFQEFNLGSGSGTSIVETTGHNFILTANDSGQIKVMKIDSAGNQIWLKKFGLTTGLNPDNKAYNIISVTENKFLITGKYDPGIGAYNKIYAIMIDSLGNTHWENTYSTSNSIGRNATYDSLNNVLYIIGDTRFSTSDICVLKIDTGGGLLKELYIDLGSSDIAENVFIQSSNEIIISGNSDSFSSSDYDGFILNMDSSGNATWLKHYGGLQNDNFRDLHRLSDGGFMILGSNSSSGSGISETWLLRTNSTGDTLWTRTIGFTTSDVPYHFAFRNDNSIWICGKILTSTPDVAQGWIAQIDSLGNILTSNIFGALRNETFFSIIASSQNSVFALGESITGVFDSFIYLVRLDSLNSLNVNNDLLPFEKIIAFPNPTSDFVDIILPNDYDSKSGTMILINDRNQILQFDGEILNNKIRINLPNNPGIYFFGLYSKYKRYVFPIIKN